MTLEDTGDGRVCLRHMILLSLAGAATSRVAGQAEHAYVLLQTKTRRAGGEARFLKDRKEPESRGS